MSATRPTGWRVRTSSVIVVFTLAAALAGSPRLLASNGDVLQASTVLRGFDLSDLCFDSSDDVEGGAFWVLGRLNGKIYHVSRDLSTKLAEIPNPHGVGQFPNLILSQGITYRPSTDTLFVLAQHGAEWLVKEVDKTTGEEIAAGSFLVEPPVDGAALHGLAYDTLEDELWLLDAANDLLFRTSTLSGSTPLPEPLVIPGAESEAEIKGEGLSYEEEAGAGTLYVAYGDLFVKDPSRVIQLRVSDGTCTGVEVPLPDGDVGGIQTYPLAQQRRLAAIGGDGTIFEIEQTVSSVRPPSHLACSLTLRNQVELRWTNNGDAVDSSYSGEIQILRNGVPVASVSGRVETYLDTTPSEGPSRYSLRASAVEDPDLSHESAGCLVTVGPGGLIEWTTLGGRHLYDLTTHADTGEVFVTDDVAGEVLRLDADLELLEPVPSPWEKPGPIAFVSQAEIVIPFADPLNVENVLAVCSTDVATRTQVRYVTLEGEPLVTIQASFRVNGEPVANPVIGGMTFIPDEEQLAFLERNSRTIIITTMNGAFVRTCVPSPLILPDRVLEFGLAYEPLEKAFMTPFDDGLVREFLPGGTCLPTGFEFPLDSLGEGFSDEGFLRGVSIFRNTMLVCGTESETVFKLLLIPAGNAFVRGDFDGNTVVNMTDVVAEASYLFLDGAAPSCADAGDVNDDGELSISDPTYLLFYLFLEGPTPPAPFPSADADPTRRDPLGCGEGDA